MSRRCPSLMAAVAALSFALPIPASGQEASSAQTIVKVVHVPTQVRAGEYFSLPPVVLVTDSHGNAQSNTLVRIAVDTGSGYLSGQETVRTDAAGLATFDSLLFYGEPGLKQFVFMAGEGSQTQPVTVLQGDPTTLLVTRQASPRIASDSPMATQPVVRVLDNAGNPLRGIEVQAKLCYGKAAENVQCDPLRTGLSGVTVAKTDTAGEATFTDLAITGPEGYYQLVFRSITGVRRPDVLSARMLYDPDRLFDHSYVVISAIKSIAGTAPAGEFFDARFRFRYGRNVFALAAFDVNLISRGTDSVNSSQSFLSDGSVSLNLTILTRSTPRTTERERSLFAGPMVRVFNTLPYFGANIGSVEHGASPFQGSTFSLALLHRMSDTMNVVSGDTVTSRPWSLLADFFLRSSSIDFFRTLNLRGGFLLPLRSGSRLECRIVVSVPVGTLNLF